MTESEYRELPRGVRERFSALRDEDFAEHPDVAAALYRLKMAEAAHRQACESASVLRQRKVAVAAIGDQALAKLRELHSFRVQNVVDALLITGIDVAIQFDSQIRDDTERLALTAEAVPRAIAQADEQLVALNRRIQLAANDIQSASEEHRGVLDRLKLAAAQA